MELVMIITVLSFFFSGLLPHCSTSLQLPLMKPPLQYQVNAHHLSLPPFPRKLMSKEQQVKEHEATTTHGGASRRNDKQNSSGKEEKEKEQKMMKQKKRRKGTRQEWVEEGEDPSQYFTMDYSRVRRRRPIHNKNIPVAP